MSTALDQRIDELLGDQAAEVVDCPVFLEMPEPTAVKVAESLRWALYGGQEPAGGRRVLLTVLDAITLALSNHEHHEEHTH